MLTTGLSEQTQKNLALLTKVKFVNKYYLAGGTGLSLYYGHRFSHDLDFFSQTPVEPIIIRSKLQQIGKLEIYQNDEDTFNGQLNNIKLSFFIYPYMLIEKPDYFENIKIASIIDIGCMKIDAISSRGTKKDFIDLYFICHRTKKLEDLIDDFKKKYTGFDYNLIHIYKSLIYFINAEESEMPLMIEKVDWNDVKKFFEKEVVRLGRKYIK